jgi:hypothetical protein
MVRIVDFTTWPGGRVVFHFSNGIVAGGDMVAFVEANDPRAKELSPADLDRGMHLRDGVPILSNGYAFSPGRILAEIERAVRRAASIDDNNEEAIAIAKSGAPEPTPALAQWLADECKARWRYRCDGIWTLHFGFESEDDANRFVRRWCRT